MLCLDVCVSPRLLYIHTEYSHRHIGPQEQERKGKTHTTRINITKPSDRGGRRRSAVLTLNRTSLVIPAQSARAQQPLNQTLNGPCFVAQQHSCLCPDICHAQHKVNRSQLPSVYRTRARSSFRARYHFVGFAMIGCETTTHRTATETRRLKYRISRNLGRYPRE